MTELAYQNGKTARRADLDIDASNPYRRNTANYRFFQDGWEEVDEELKVEPTTEITYEVKSWPWLFKEMITGVKKHDMRDKRDRDYKVGDMMKLREFDPTTGMYTGRWAVFQITYITDNVTPCAMSSSSLDRNFAILSVELVEWSPGCRV